MLTDKQFKNNKAMITKNMRKALNEQINAELWSAYLYLSMSMDAEAKALRGIANWFFVQWMEEQDHARIFQNYLNEQGEKVELKAIDRVPLEWKDALEMFRDTLSHEKDVTAMIHNLMKMAMKEDDFETMSRLLWFVDEQVEEERSAEDLVKLLEAAGDDFSIINEIDGRLAGRKYNKASPLKQ